MAAPSLESLELDDRLVRLYQTALRASHAGGKVEVHFGSAVVARLRSRAQVDVPRPWAAQPRFANFPVVTHDDYPPDHIAVHVVEVIV